MIAGEKGRKRIDSKVDLVNKWIELVVLINNTNRMHVWLAHNEQVVRLEAVQYPRGIDSG